MSKKITIMQPTYLPWIGYFDLINWADTFIFLDDVEFSHQSWQHRNKIKTSDGPLWLTVPVRQSGRSEQLIQNVEICNKQPWRRKHFRSIKFNYSRTDYWDEYAGFFEEVYQDCEWDMLAALNVFIIESLSTFLGIDATFRRSSGLAIEPTSRADMLASICSHFDASCFLSPLGALDYHLRDELHAQMDTEVVYQHFDHPEYDQLHGDFRSHLSAIDLLLNEGRDSLEIIRKGSKSPYSAEETLRKSEA